MERNYVDKLEAVEVAALSKYINIYIYIILNLG